MEIIQRFALLHHSTRFLCCQPIRTSWHWCETCDSEFCKFLHCQLVVNGMLFKMSSVYIIYLKMTILLMRKCSFTGMAYGIKCTNCTWMAKSHSAPHRTPLHSVNVTAALCPRRPLINPHCTAPPTAFHLPFTSSGPVPCVRTAQRGGEPLPDLSYSLGRISCKQHALHRATMTVFQVTLSSVQQEHSSQ